MYLFWLSFGTVYEVMILWLRMIYGYCIVNEHVFRRPVTLWMCIHLWLPIHLPLLQFNHLLDTIIYESIISCKILPVDYCHSLLVSSYWCIFRLLNWMPIYPRLFLISCLLIPPRYLSCMQMMFASRTYVNKRLT